jgi:putative oxidoreductase
MPQSAAQPALSPAPSPKGRTIVLWTLQILAALAFLAAGGSKLAGAQAMVDTFEKVGLGQWFRYLTGILEVGGAIGLLMPKFSFYAAALLVCVMVGAVITHLAILGGSPLPAIVLLLITGAIAYLRRPVR